MLLQIPKDQCRCNYIKVKVRVHRHLDGTISLFHGPRRLAWYDQHGQQIFNKELLAA